MPESHENVQRPTVSSTTASFANANITTKAVAWWLDYVWVFWWQTRLILTPPSWRRAPKSYELGSRPPVVLLPGVYETWQFLQPIADRLNAAGHPIHVVGGLGYNRLGIVESSAVVARYITERELRGVVLVAHSKGGLIGKQLMTTDDAESRVRHLVAINTPFGGSTYARLIPLRTVRIFSPAEPTIVMLRERKERNSRISSIFSSFDPHIPGGSALEGARNLQLPLMGHFRPLGHRLLIDTVEREVDEVLPTP